MQTPPLMGRRSPLGGGGRFLLLRGGFTLATPRGGALATDQSARANFHDNSAEAHRAQLVKETFRNGVASAEVADRERAIVVGIIIVIFIGRAARRPRAASATAVLVLRVGIGDELPAGTRFDDRIRWAVRLARHRRALHADSWRTIAPQTARAARAQLRKRA